MKAKKKKTISNRKDALVDTSLYNCAYAGVAVNITPIARDLTGPRYSWTTKLKVTLTKSRFQVAVTCSYFYELRYALVDAINKFNELPTHCDTGNLEMPVREGTMWTVREHNVYDGVQPWHSHRFEKYEDAKKFFKTGEYI